MAAHAADQEQEVFFFLWSKIVPGRSYKVRSPDKGKFTVQNRIATSALPVLLLVNLRVQVPQARDGNVP